MTETDRYIAILTNLKPGSLGLLRTHAGQSLDESVAGFDLFTGLWWPLRQRNQRAPRREVAWLITKLYAFSPIPHTRDAKFSVLLRQCQPNTDPAKERFRQRFDRMLLLPVSRIEASLRWGVDLIASKQGKLDWVSLTNDLSAWQRETIRLRWAEQFLGIEEREQPC